jgi:hypothetical protein
MTQTDLDSSPASEAEDTAIQLNTNKWFLPNGKNVAHMFEAYRNEAGMRDM